MSDTENIVFKKGLGNLPLPNVENGSVLIETDSGRMYIDDNDVRTQISRKISNGDELPTEGVKEGDIFLKDGADNGEEDMFNLLYPIVNEHVNADNPHGITREYLGAAKEGYVYKVITDVDTEADLENALNAELATMSGNTVRFLVISTKTSNYLFGGCGTLCELYCRTKDYGTAKFTWYSDYKTPNIAYKNIYGGVWDPLAWLNPPMVAGEDYRTTERWNGKPVYMRFIDLGKIPKSTYKSVNWTSDENVQVISVRGVVGANYNDFITVPTNNFNGAVGTFSLKGQRNLITIFTDYDYGDLNLYAELRYIY